MKRIEVSNVALWQSALKKIITVGKQNKLK